MLRTKNIHVLFSFNTQTAGELPTGAFDVNQRQKQNENIYLWLKRLAHKHSKQRLYALKTDFHARCLAWADIKTNVLPYWAQGTIIRSADPGKNRRRLIFRTRGSQEQQ